LVHAYSRAVSTAVEAAGIVCMKLCGLLHVCCDYGQYGRIEPLILRWSGVVSDSRFGENVELDFALPKKDIAGFCAELTELSAGTLTAEILGEMWAH